MAEIVRVAGTLDEKNLDFAHTYGTEYAAVTPLETEEGEHLAVIAAEDSAGNSVMESFFVAVSGSWSTPKTDWYGSTNADGIYTGDRFNNTDFNRIKNNLVFLSNIATAMYPAFSINDVGVDRTKEQYFYADEIAKLQENINIISENTVLKDYGEYPVYTANGNVFDYNELNRIESAILDLYNNLMNQYRGRRMLIFNLGMTGREVI